MFHLSLVENVSVVAQKIYVTCICIGEIDIKVIIMIWIDYNNNMYIQSINTLYILIILHFII